MVLVVFEALLGDTESMDWCIGIGIGRYPL
jgi:hypothetical protein